MLKSMYWLMFNNFYVHMVSKVGMKLVQARFVVLVLGPRLVGWWHGSERHHAVRCQIRTDTERVEERENGRKEEREGGGRERERERQWMLLEECGSTEGPEKGLCPPPD